MATEDGSLRERLIAVAVQALERGESDVSLRALAREAGVSAMAPYRHFTDKAALMGAVAGHGFEQLRAAVLEADAEAEGSAAVVAQGLAYYRFAQAHPALFRLMFSGACDTPSPSGETAYGVLAARVATLTDDPDAVLACWALVHGLAVLALDRQGAPGAGVTGDPASVLRLLADRLAKA
ncbi:TetR/AcrR family transcriptional regulator [Aureimonas sp. AU20]|uniref:TetR/AcrR family transcriptional regulator n=1 Tax=Aureimonas sp. AU20 TaxID=1349819 RepID=UPI0007218FB8|nr:TetR/AcrR family transcriptional regulator [Aureimonas sp. AU20]ALN71986.1 hypothetical protein M673_04615 [Aureimonas sp. AU20]